MAARLTKRNKAIRAQIERNKPYALADALSLVKSCASAKFNESVDIAVPLGVDAKKSDQVVRGSVVLPSGTGKRIDHQFKSNGRGVAKSQARVLEGRVPAQVVGFEHDGRGYSD